MASMATQAASCLPDGQPHRAIQRAPALHDMANRHLWRGALRTLDMNSQFFLSGSSVLTVVFAMGGAWPLLALSFLVMMVGIWLADREQIAAQAPDTLAMFVQDERPLLPLDYFQGEQLLWYQAGTPVYRILQAQDTTWELVGNEGEVPFENGMIRVVPGLLYRQRPDS